MLDNTSVEVKCHKLSRGVASGEILISNDDICFYLAEPETGILRDKGHDLDGQSLAGKVLVFPSGKGSAVVQDEGLFSMKKYGNLPRALIIQKPETVLVFSSLLLKLPLVDRVDEHAYKYFHNGLNVQVDADNGLITTVPS